MQNQKRKPHAVPATPLTAEVKKHIQSVAHLMTGSFGPFTSDTDDVIQELTLQIIKAFPAYDPDRCAYYTFAQSVIRHAKGNIHRMRKNKRLTVTESLDVAVCEDGETAAERIADERDALGLDLLVFDVREILSQLSPDERLVCELIMDGCTTREIPKRLGVSRSRFFRSIWPFVQEKFRKLADA